MLERLNRTILKLGAIALTLRTLFPPHTHIDANGNRLLGTSGSPLPSTGSLGIDLPLLQTHLVTIMIVTLLFAFALAKPKAIGNRGESQP